MSDFPFAQGVPFINPVTSAGKMLSFFGRSQATAPGAQNNLNTSFRFTASLPYVITGVWVHCQKDTFATGLITSLPLYEMTISQSGADPSASMTSANTLFPRTEADGGNTYSFFNASQSYRLRWTEPMYFPVRIPIRPSVEPKRIDFFAYGPWAVDDVIYADFHFDYYQDF